MNKTLVYQLDENEIELDVSIYDNDSSINQIDMGNVYNSPFDNKVKVTLLNSTKEEVKNSAKNNKTASSTSSHTIREDNEVEPLASLNFNKQSFSKISNQSKGFGNLSEALQKNEIKVSAKYW